LGGTLPEQLLRGWEKEETMYPHLPSLVSWHIWLERNKTIFEQSNPSINTIYYKILGGLECAKTQKEPIQRFLQPTLQLGRTTAWFDGATQNFGQQCGAGGLIRTVDHTILSGPITVELAQIQKQNSLESGQHSPWQPDFTLWICRSWETPEL
jgi:hypothetical protein